MGDPSLGPSIVQAVGVVVAAGVSFLGARRGARRELNGTAQAVREIKQDQKKHIESVAEEFRGVRKDMTDLVDRVGTSEGYLEALMEQGIAAKRAKRAKRTTRRKPLAREKK